MGARICKVEYYLPEQVIKNDFLEKEFKRWTADQIEKKLGIKERHVVHKNETALDLAVEASKKVLEGYNKEKIDFVMLCTQSPDYFLPSSACILQDKLELGTNVGALDYNLGCSGYVYGLALAKGLISSNIATNVLLVMSETYSKHIHPKDVSNRTIFGDGAAATIIEKCEEEGLLDFDLGTNGKGACNLIVEKGGFRNPIEIEAAEITDESGNVRTGNNLFMNGTEVFNFTIDAVPKTIANILKKQNLTIEDIDYIIFHQANKYMIDYLRKKIKIPKEKFFSDMLETGNTVSATIPIALKKSLESGVINSGNKVLLCGFGVGFSWGTCVINI